MAKTMLQGTNYKAPLSGQILGAVLKALQFQDPVLSSKTAQRYFNGLRVGEDSKYKVFEAVGKAIMDSGIIPLSPFLEREGFPLPRVISMVIACYASQWDLLVGYMRTTSAPVDRQDLAALSYLRLAVIDLALRTSAVLWLTDMAPPEEGTPLWAQENGGSKYLRQILYRRGKSRPTRDHLAEQLDVSNNTVDSWLDNSVRPSADNIDRIAEVLGQHISGLQVDSPRSRLHRHYALVSLCDLLAQHLGRDAVIELAMALVRFTNRNSAGLREFSKLDAEDASMHQFLILLFGVRFTPCEHLLRALWRQESDRVWRTDLTAAFKPWHLRLTHVARQLGGLGQAMQLASDEFGIPVERAEELMERVLQEVQADLTSMGIRDPSELEGKMIVRVKGDERFSARNRIIQYSQVAYLSYTIAGEPNVARLQVPVDDASAVGELQPPAGLFGNVDGLFQAKTVVGSVLDDAFHVAATH